VVLAYARSRDLDLNVPRAYGPNARADIRRLNRLRDELGTRWVAEIVERDLTEMADRLLPGRSAATKNRDVIIPACAVLNYAVRQGWSPRRKVKPYKEPKPRTRSVSLAAERALIAAARTDQQRLLLLWLFRQGTRISETLGVRWHNESDVEGIDLANRIVRMRVKGDFVRTFPLADEILAELAKIPEAARRGKLFSWDNRHNVYRWLKPLARAQGVAFTPHMARHTVGTRLNANGVGLRTIMDVLGHQTPESSIRYQTAEISTTRAAINALADPPHGEAD
jgi:integrase